MSLLPSIFTRQVACDFFSVLDANNCNEKTRLIFIEENHGSNSSFVIGSFMWQAKAIENAEIILLTCHNSIQHYQHVLSKWGHVTRNSSPKTNAINLSDYSEENAVNVTKLFESIYKNCENFNNHKTYLIIDDLGYLLMLSSLRHCVHFSQQLLRLLADFKLLRIIVCCHISGKDEELSIISKFFHHLSNFILSIEPLKSGFSNEVTGHLKVIQRGKLKGNVNRYNFKLDDKKFTLNPRVI